MKIWCGASGLADIVVEEPDQLFILSWYVGVSPTSVFGRFSVPVQLLQALGQHCQQLVTLISGGFWTLLSMVEDFHSNGPV